MTNTYNRDLHTHTIKEYEVKKNTTQRDFSIGLSLGLVVGTFAGLLLAPKAGKDLQQDISDKSDELKEKSAEHYNNQLENARSFKEKSNDFKNKISEKTSDLKDKVQKKDSTPVSDVKVQQQAIKEEVKDDNLKGPLAVVDKELDTPIKDETKVARATTIDMAKDVERLAKNKK